MYNLLEWNCAFSNGAYKLNILLTLMSKVELCRGSTLLYHTKCSNMIKEIKGIRLCIHANITNTISPFLDFLNFFLKEQINIRSFKYFILFNFLLWCYIPRLSFFLFILFIFLGRKLEWVVRKIIVTWGKFLVKNYKLCMKKNEVFIPSLLT